MYFQVHWEIIKLYNFPDGAENIRLHCGMLVACYLAQYDDEEPQLGEVLSLKGQNMVIQWMIGSYTKPWKVYKQKIGKELVPWTEEVPTSAVILSVQLSPDGMLDQGQRSKLIDAYKHIRSISS